MKTYVEFISEAFPPYDGEEDEINLGRWRKRLAEFLADGINKAGIATDEIFSEDWGWVIPVRNKDFKLWVGCGNYEEYPNGFLCFIEPSKPYVRKLFKKISTIEKVTQLREAIDKLLSSNSNVQNIKWWTTEEFNNQETQNNTLN